jgi:hypothetical protein
MPFISKQSRQFLTILERPAIEVTNENFADLCELCKEFGVETFAGELSNFQNSGSTWETFDTETSSELFALRTELANLHQNFAAPQQEILRLTAEIESLRHEAAPPISPSSFDSVIILAFPMIFSEFRGMQFSLLWRGSDDGFGASDFHDRWDGQANTLTVILDTSGNIFGGYLHRFGNHIRKPNTRGMTVWIVSFSRSRIRKTSQRGSLPCMLRKRKTQSDVVPNAVRALDLIS